MSTAAVAAAAATAATAAAAAAAAVSESVGPDALKTHTHARQGREKKDFSMRVNALGRIKFGGDGGSGHV